MKKKCICIVLTAALLLSMLTIGMVGVSAETGTLGTYTPSAGAVTQRLMFAMPGSWTNEETAANGNCAGIYWWAGLDKPDDISGGGWPGYKTGKLDEQGVDNLWYCDVPAYGNGEENNANCIIWNNYVKGGANVQMTVDVPPQFYCRNDDKEVYEPLFRYTFLKQAQLCGLNITALDLQSDSFWDDINRLAAQANGEVWNDLPSYQRDYQIDLYLDAHNDTLDFSEYGSYASNFFNEDMVYELYPDEETAYLSLSFTFDNMVYVIDLENASANVSGNSSYQGEFYFYYGGGEYGTWPTKALNTANGGTIGSVISEDYLEGSYEPQQPTDPQPQCDHDWSYEIYPADCGHTGMTRFTCANCDEVYDYHVVERNGRHDFENGFCTVCGMPDITTLEEITVSAGKTVDPSQDDKAYFRFTPAEDGILLFWAEGGSRTAHARIYTEDLGVVGEGDGFDIQTDREVRAGENYILEVTGLDPDDDPFDVKVWLEGYTDPGPNQPLPAPAWDQRSDGKIYLYIDPSLNIEANNITAYVYEHNGYDFYDWGSSTGNMTDEGNGIWSFDLAAKGITLNAEKQYGVIFTADWDARSCELMLTTSCLGDIAYFTGFGYEDPSNDAEDNGVVYWVHQDRGFVGPVYMVTSSARIIGDAFWADETPQSLFINCLNILNTNRNWILSERDAQEIIDEAIIVLRLTLDEAEAIIEDSGYTFHWSRDYSIVNPEPQPFDRDKTIPFEYTIDYIYNNYVNGQANSLLKIKRIVTDLLLEKDETEQAVVDRGFEPGEEEDLIALLEDVFKTIGDINGDNAVSIEDATLIQRFLAEYTTDGGEPLLDEDSELVKYLGDLNRDDRISIKDVTELQRFLAEFIAEFPLEPKQPENYEESYIWPCPGYYNVTSYFGEDRGIGTTGGIELAAPSGTPVVAANGGTVAAVYSGCIHNYGKAGDCGCGGSGGYGNYVFIDHGNGKMTIYAHLSSTAVQSDQHISAGEIIGYVGATGNITGNALYFECRCNGIRYDPMTEY